jgi:tetratricopeptide (TPR) repeat protein
MFQLSPARHARCTKTAHLTATLPLKNQQKSCRTQRDSTPECGDKKVAVHNFVGAIDDYTRATELNPTFARIYAPKTDYFLLKSNLEQLLADYDRILLTNPENPYALAIRGEIKFNLRDKVGAEADFRKSLHYKRDLYFANLRLTEANLFLQPQNVTENVKSTDFDTTLKLFPNSARMHHNMGLALGRLGFAEMAAAEYEGS